MGFHQMLLMMEWEVRTREEVGVIQIYIVPLHLRTWHHHMEVEADQE